MTPPGLSVRLELLVRVSGAWIRRHPDLADDDTRDVPESSPLRPPGEPAKITCDRIVRAAAEVLARAVKHVVLAVRSGWAFHDADGEKVAAPRHLKEVDVFVSDTRARARSGPEVSIWSLWVIKRHATSPPARFSSVNRRSFVTMSSKPWPLPLLRLAAWSELGHVRHDERVLAFRQGLREHIADPAREALELHPLAGDEHRGTADLTDCLAVDQRIVQFVSAQERDIVRRREGERCRPGTIGILRRDSPTNPPRIPLVGLSSIAVCMKAIDLKPNKRLYTWRVTAYGGRSTSFAFSTPDDVALPCAETNCTESVDRRRGGRSVVAVPRSSPARGCNSELDQLCAPADPE